MKDDRKTTEIPSFLKGEDNSNEQTMEIEIVPEPVRKKDSIEIKNKPKKSSQEMIISFLLFAVLTVILVIAGINIAGFFMNNSGSAAEAEPTSSPTVEPTELPGFTPTPEPVETPVVTTNGQGSLSVLVDQITIRNSPSLNGEAMGTVYSGQSYTVYDVQQADVYTWYEIDEVNGGWIASDGSWVSYTSN